MGFSARKIHTAPQCPPAHSLHFSEIFLVLLCSLEHDLELKEQERDQFGGWDKGLCQGCGGWDGGDGSEWSCVPK